MLEGHSVDAVDRKLLAALQQDSQITHQALGARIGLSPSATHRRVKLLEARGIIAGYRAVLAEDAFGPVTTILCAVTLVDQRKETLERFEAAVARCPQVVEGHLMSGESDYLLKIRIGADDSYERLHRETLSMWPGVQRLVSNFAIRALKRDARARVAIPAGEH